MDAGTLHTEIAKVCPIVGAQVGKSDDRATWSFEPEEGATQAEKDAGNNVIATIDVNYEVSAPPAPEDVVLYDHENRLRSLEGAPPLEMDSFLQAKRNAKVP